LIGWFDREGRKLPWRETRDPYRILVSEIMLQQTNVDLVIPIYEKFLNDFPTIEKLANTSLPQITRITDQLGYKRRGEYLHDIAKEIVFERKGKFPSTLEDLLTLKGIGRYTAGAILCFAFERTDRTAAILDVNVERVLGRIFGLYKLNRNSTLEKELWKLAELIIENIYDDVWTINQGILDLGALVCTAQKPKCPLCPMMDICEYYTFEVPKTVSLDNFFQQNSNV
jgi:A/G-specific adenine glycosylase